MSFDYLTNAPLEKAREDYIDFLLKSGLAPGTETVPVTAAHGRVTAKAVYARICAPHYHACAMDGIALDARLTFGAGETTPVRIPQDKFVCVDTGDPLPEGCDAVVMIEDVIRERDGSAALYAPAAPWQYIRQIGEDVCAGEMILPSRTLISPAAVGAMIAGGVRELEVLKKPLVGIIPTGDEIVPPDTDPQKGDILEFNSSIFSGMIEDWGGEAKTYSIVPDDYEKILAALKKAAAECDAVLLNAGSSAGREDYSAMAAAEAGQVLLHGVAIKPGKPAILARIGSKPVLGVPGYPVSGIIVIEEFLKPVLDLLLGRAAKDDDCESAVLSRSVVSGLKYREFVRVRLGSVGGRLTASPLSRGAGVVTSFVKADGMLEIPQGLEGCEAGSEVRVKLLRPRDEIMNTLVVIGSHDPLLDELSDIMHAADPGFYMSSTHVGSMGGLMAVRRGEAHAAGTHLLDESDGSYNSSYIRKYFPGGGVRLVECVGRTQGVMLAPGNPGGIREFSDLARDGISYVNRQKGSGTRVLFDYLCRKNGMDAGSIYGYDREELTHTAVAAQIAAGSGDAGMGIWSAAKLYGLDFLPVCMEQYDLLIPDAAWDTPMVTRLLETMAGAAFRERLAALGGYDVKAPGRVRYRF